MKDIFKEVFPSGVNSGRDELIVQAENFYAANAKSAETMFGYPSHTTPLSAKTQYLLLLHYTSPFSNNCGDIDERGNYSMDTKAVEKRIVGLFAKKFGMGDDFWGYVTSGGTESNTCAVSLACNKYPSATLYYSQSAHYSIAKAARLYKHFEIPADCRDNINLDALFQVIEKNYERKGAPAGVMLTFGTTKFGACDPIDKLTSFLISRKIPSFVHVDAAHFGGIPNNQNFAPTLENLKERGVDSVCVSMHKYLGFPDVHSVFVSTSKPAAPEVAYIGQHDTTVSGSRSIPAYALLNHLEERLFGRDPDEYCKNIILFEKMLTENKVDFYRAPCSNIFVIDKPSDEVCKQFQLSTFDVVENRKNVDKAHIIIFPHHKKENMLKLVNAIK